MSNELQHAISLHAVRQEIQTLSVQLEKGLVDLSGGPARSIESFKDTLDCCTRLLTQGARVVCIGEGGKSSVINCIVQARMHPATDYDQINQKDRGEILQEVSYFLLLHSILSIPKGCRTFT
jgi:hypothetical protein